MFINKPNHKASRLYLATMTLSILICYEIGLSERMTSSAPDRSSKPKPSQDVSRRSHKQEFYTTCGTKVRASEVLVKFTRPVTPRTVQALSEQLAKRRHFWFEEVGSGATVYLIHIDGLKVTELITRFRALKVRRPRVMVEEEFAVQEVEPNFVFEKDGIYSVLHQNNVPDDLDPEQQWGLLDSTNEKGGISAVSAWKSSQGSRDIVVGVVDTGVSYSHPDLLRNMWCAPRDFTVRVAGQDITCPKGTHGFSARSKTCNPKNTSSHGTEVSGIVGAEGNNTTGVVGVNWRISIMGLLWSDGTGDYRDILNAISFAVEVKKQGDLADIRVLNNSYGSYALPDPSCRPVLLADKIQEANDCGILFVASAGDLRINTDTSPHYPSGLGLPNIISVAATTVTDGLYSYSSYGQRSVHLGAPGAQIKSTSSSNGYSFGGGTSYAAPFVSGAAALILSKPGSPCANMTVVQLKECILESADKVPSLQRKLPQGRRLNVNRAITDCEKYLH